MPNLSNVEYTANGATTTFVVPFSYIEEADITVTVDDIVVTGYTFNGSGDVVFAVAPLDTLIVYISRDSDVTQRVTTYSDGSELTESDLNNGGDQSIYLHQETRDLIGTINAENALFESRVEQNEIDIASNDVDIAAAEGAIISNTIAINDNITNIGAPTISVASYTPAAAPAYAEGKLFYDNSSNSMSYYNDEAEIKMDIGQELWVKARNNTGVTITNGQVVYISGAVGQISTIALADADSVATSQVIGVATHDIENASNGYVTTFGLVNGLDTSAYTEGDSLYLSSTAGALTITPPVYPKEVIHVCTVTNSNALTGQILVKSHTEVDAIIAALVAADIVLQTNIDTNATNLSDHEGEATGAHAASSIANTPSGNLAATDIQGAVDELQTDIDTRALASGLSDHINETTGAHAASSIVNTPLGNLAAINVQTALDELQTDIDGKGTRLDTAEATIITNTAEAPKSKISSADTTNGYLEDKVVVQSGSGIFLDKLNTGADEQLAIRIGDHFKQALSTGLISGGVMSIGTPTTTFSISDGDGIIVDGITVTPISWSGETNLTVTNIATSPISFITIDSGGLVVQRTSKPTNAQRRDEVFLGVIVHVDGVNVNAINTEASLSLHPAQQTQDLAAAIGMFNLNGNVFGPSGADMTFDKDVGNIFFTGANYDIDPSDPSKRNMPLLTDIAFQYRFQDGSNRLGSATGEAVIDPDSYDLAGVETAVTNNRFTVQRIYQFLSGSIKLQMGQNVYSNLAEAREGIKNDSFVTEPSIAANGLLRGFLILKKGCTDLTDAAEAEFIQAEKFGTTSGSGGVSVTSLQGAYNNSTDPELLTDATRGAVTFKRGSAADTDDVFEVMNGAGSQVFGVKGDGTINGLSEQDIDGGTASNTSRITVPKASKATLDALTRKEATIMYASDENKLYADDGTTLQEIGSGGGAGGINYMTGANTDAEAGLGDWVTYADAAGENPVDGTAGTATTTYATNATTPMRGGADFKMVKDAANRQGEGASCAFTVDVADKAQKLTCSFDYDTSHAGYADDDIRLSVYDVTNSVLIRVNGEDLKGGKGNHIFQFQTASDSVSYRLIMHVSSTSAVAYDVYFDNIQVGPREVVKGGVTIESVRYDGHLNYGSTATRIIEFENIRANTISTTGTLVNDSTNGFSFTALIDCQVNISTSLDFSASSRDFGISLNASSLTTNIGSLTASEIVGSSTAVGAGDSYTSTANVKLSAGDVLRVHTDGGTLTATSNLQGMSLTAVANANTVQSSDLGGREIVAEGRGNNGAVITASTTNINFTETRDTTASFDGTTFTAPETGSYIVSGSIQANGLTLARFLGYVNTVHVYTLSIDDVNADLKPFHGVVSLNKGDVFSIRSNITFTLFSTATLHHIHIQKLASPQTILETETVAARYTSNSGQAVNSSVSVFTYENLDFDTHNAYSSGTYTTPVSGYYQIDATYTVNASFSAAQTVQILCYIDDVLKLLDVMSGAATAAIMKPEISTVLYLNKGQTVKISGYCAATTTATTNDSYNYFSIARIK